MSSRAKEPAAASPGPAALYPGAVAAAITLCVIVDLGAARLSTLEWLRLLLLSAAAGAVLGAGAQALVRGAASLPAPVQLGLRVGLPVGCGLQLATTLGAFARIGSAYSAQAWVVLVLCVIAPLGLAIVITRLPLGQRAAALPPGGRRRPVSIRAIVPMAAFGLTAGVLAAADQMFFVGLYPGAHLGLRVGVLLFLTVALLLAPVVIVPRLRWRGVLVLLLLGSLAGALPGPARGDLQTLFASTWAGSVYRGLRWATDLDGDGYSHLLGGGDCAPLDATIGPESPEIPGNGRDDNCLAGDAPAPTGSPPAGSPPAGSPPAGSPPAGSPSADSPPAGSPPADFLPGDSAPGDPAPTDSAPTDSAPTDSAPADPAPADSPPAAPPRGAADNRQTEAAWAIPISQWPARGKSRNLVLITLDAVRADAIDGPSPAMPHLARWAEHATWFRCADSTGSRTRVALASILGGRFARNTTWRRIAETSAGRVVRLSEGEPPDQGDAAVRPFWIPVFEPGMFLPEVLAQAGLATIAVIDDLYSARLSPVRGFARGFHIYHLVDPRPLPANEQTMPLGEHPRGDRGTVAAAAEALDRLGRNGQRFFLWAHFFGPHVSAESRPDADSPARGVAAGYRHALQHTDLALSRLLAQLDTDAADTAVIVTADHGEQIFRGHRDHGGDLSRAELRVPLVIRAPGFGAGPVDRCVSTIDLAPTIFALLGVRAPAELDGQVLIPAQRRGSALAPSPMDGQALMPAQRRGSALAPSPMDEEVLLPPEIEPRATAAADRMWFADTYQYRHDGHRITDLSAVIRGSHKLVFDLMDRVYFAYELTATSERLADPEAPWIAPLVAILNDYLEHEQHP